jgi:MFS family permease
MLMTYGGIYIYGLSVGAFGVLSQTYLERRYGKDNFLISMPFLLPVSFRRVFLGMYLRDVIFYSALMLLPALGGVALGAALSSHSLLSVMVIFGGLLVTFLYGMSTSFLVSVLFGIDRRLFLLAVGALIALMAGYGLTGLYGLDLIIPSLGYQLNALPFPADWPVALGYLAVCAVLSVAFLALSLVLVRPGRSVTAGRHREMFLQHLSFFSKFPSRTLLAKEFVDIRRSGLTVRMVFAYIVPLVFLSFTTYYVNHGLNIPVGFNAVFYGAMVGFFGVLLYSWMTNTDLNDYYETLPVRVPQVIRSKLMAYFLLTTGVSTLFVIGISMLNDEWQLLWLALVVLYCTTAYMVLATAYLTGLNTNSFFFNPTVLTKFTAISILPDLLLTILSFSLQSGAWWALTGILGVCGVLLVLSAYFYRGIERKWGAASFL